MKLTAKGASPEQIAAGESAARAFLAEKGVTMEQVHEACAIYERWVEGCSGPDDLPPQEGADVRAIFAQAGRIAIDTALPHLAGADHWRGQLEPWDVAPPDPEWLNTPMPDPLPF